MANTTEQIENLAAEIGENIYIDVAKWHLFLSDAHLHTIIAERVYPLLEDNALNEDAVEEILRGIPVNLGGGKRSLPLIDLVPEKCQRNLMDLLEEYKNEM